MKARLRIELPADMIHDDLRTPRTPARTDRKTKFRNPVRKRRGIRRVRRYGLLWIRRGHLKGEAILDVRRRLDDQKPWIYEFDNGLSFVLGQS